jgi:drug/metabolite transporter (DMT)-like permease
VGNGFVATDISQNQTPAHRQKHMLNSSHKPTLRGAAMALLAAVLFGVSTPLVQHFGVGLGAFTTASLLYTGAALIGFLLRQPVATEAHLQHGDWRRILAMASFGAVIGPVALAWGLQRTRGGWGCVMLSLEALFTALLAWGIYRETMGRRVWMAMLLLLAGGAVLVLDQGQLGRTQLTGLIAVLLATAAWGTDNALSRGVADRDPGRVVLAKAALGACATLLMAAIAGEPLPTTNAAVALLAVGAKGYGLSLRFYLLAQRSFGAARTGSVFAFAPLIGALVAFSLDERSASTLLVLGGSLMVLGVLLHLAETHQHTHLHDALLHEHAHRHDDGHHHHPHSDLTVITHSHAHQHEPQSHSHAHAPDAHHVHRH